MKVYFKVEDVKDDLGFSTADLSSKTMNVDELISLLKKAKSEERKDVTIPIMCDDWYRQDQNGLDPRNHHSNHCGILHLKFCK